MASCRMALLCLLGLSVVASPAVAHPDSGIYYQIAFMWPGAYCEQTNAGCCMPMSPIVPAADFYVSGFTVYNDTTDAPMTHCNKNSPFNFTQVSQVENIMKYWSNIKCPSSSPKNSWKSAWKTSGVCSGLGQAAYFQAALALRDRINPLARLASKEIKPDLGLYSVERIKEVIKEGIQVTPVIQCSKGPFEKLQLYQIFVCVAGDAKTLIECPKPQRFTCPDQIVFHPFKKWMLKRAESDVSYAEAFELDGGAAMDH